MSKKSDEKILKDIAAIKAFCEADKKNCLDEAVYWRNMPDGGIASLPSSQAFIRNAAEVAERHADMRVVDLQKMESAAITIEIVQEAAKKERSIRARKNEDKGGRPTLIEEARKIAASQSSRLKGQSKTSRAKDIYWRLGELIRVEERLKDYELPSEETIRRWPIFD